MLPLLLCLFASLLGKPWVPALVSSKHCFQTTMQDKEMVKLLLDMKERLDIVLNDAFGKAEAFGHALKDAFEHFINQRAKR
jgi:hypothetical protein